MEYIERDIQFCEGINYEQSNDQEVGDFMELIDINRYPDCRNLLIAQQELHNEIMTATQILCKYIFIDEDEFEDLIPHLLPGAETYLLAVGIAKEQFQDLEADFREFSELLGDFSTISEMSDALYCEQRKIRISQRIATYVFGKVSEMYPNWDSMRVYKCDFVQSNERWAEGIKRESEPLVEDLSRRLTRAREILAEYY
jgi:hypothetical protein